MEKWQRIAYHASKFAVLALMAWFVASGTSVLLAAELEDQLSVERASPPRRARRHPPRRKVAKITDGEPILRRNIFDSRTGPILPAADEDPFELDIPRDDLPIVPCADLSDVSAVLEATVADPDRPGWSFASVRDGKESRLLRHGDELGDRRVADITWRYLLLEGDMDSCYLDLFSGKDAKKRVKKRRKGKAKRLTRVQMRQAIKKAGPHKRIVERGAFEQALANPTRFMRGIRVRPHKRGGEIDGFRLRRVRRKSVFETLGARRGDIVHAVNGKPLTSVESALAAYQELRTANGFEFQITRKGKPITMEIDIR